VYKGVMYYVKACTDGSCSGDSTEDWLEEQGFFDHFSVFCFFLTRK